MKTYKNLISGTVGGRFVVSDQAFQSIREIEASNQSSRHRGEASKSYASKKIARPSQVSVKKIRSSFQTGKP